MSVNVVNGSKKLGSKIRARRIELNMTIEEASAKAGLGLKTWSRYEAGGSIRCDKISSVCKVLKWHKLEDEDVCADSIKSESYKHDEAWSQYIADDFGENAAMSFIIGSEILLDHIDEDLFALSKKPRDMHVGELSFSWLHDELPPQFYMRYDYEFLYSMRACVLKYREAAKSNISFVAHSVLDELILYLIMEESRPLMEEYVSEIVDDEMPDWDGWVFNLFGDMDIYTFLFSDLWLSEDHPYHFSKWREEQFYIK